MKSAKILLLAMLFVAPVVFAGTVSIQSTGVAIFPGDLFSVDVGVSNISDLYAFQFDLTFDPAIISATAISEGAFLPSSGATFFFPGTIDNIGGAITFNADTLLGAVSGASGSGVLATIQFSALGPGSSPIGLSNVILLDSSLGDISAGVINGSVTVSPEPSNRAPAGLIFMGVFAWIRSRYGVSRRTRPATTYSAQ